MTEMRKPIILGASLNYCLNKGPVTKTEGLHKQSLKIKMGERWKVYLSLILSPSEATTKNFLYVESMKAKQVNKQNKTKTET